MGDMGFVSKGILMGWIYSAMTATANTGYAGYFASSSTGAGLLPRPQLQ
jgi:hypothetical protein